MYGKNFSGLLSTLKSLQFGIVVMVTIVLIAAVGTIIPQEQPWGFYVENYGRFFAFLISIFRFDITYRSPLFISLLSLFGINLFLCTLSTFPATWKRAFNPFGDRNTPSQANIVLQNIPIEEVKNQFHKKGWKLRPKGTALYLTKYRWGYFGAFVMHVSILVFLAGSIVSLLTGKKGVIALHAGESSSLAYISANRSFPLGFEVKLDNFEVEFYPEHPGRPKSYTSRVEVTTPEGRFNTDIMVNKPLIMNNLTVYQSSWGMGDMMPAFEDTARVAVRLKGACVTIPPIITLDMAKEEEFSVPGFEDIDIKIIEIYRSFRMGDNQNHGLNPAVRLEIAKNGTPEWNVFAFENFPGLNMPQHEDLPIEFEMVGLTLDSSGGGMQTGDYYTVLGVVKDSGVGIMWFGGILMTMGLFLSFFVRPASLLVVENGGNVIVSWKTKGNSEDFADFVKYTCSAFD